MRFVEIIVDVYATLPGDAYRLYVDDDLMTERTFIWPPNENYVEEHVIIQAEEGSLHTISVVGSLRKDGFLLKNVVVDGRKTERTFQA